MKQLQFDDTSKIDIRYTLQPELQKHADRADQLVLFFVAGANFWEKHVKNCAIMSILDYFWSILDLLFGANFLGEKLVGANFYAFCNYVCNILRRQKESRTKKSR